MKQSITLAYRTARFGYLLNVLTITQATTCNLEAEALEVATSEEFLVDVGMKRLCPQ